jgi:iduronate 2-sulfatase
MPRLILCFLLMMNSAIGLSSSLAVESTAKKLNVLMICVDDLKPILGCYGDPIAKTPNLDRLAAHGLRFHGAYCNQAVCSPSRNSLMTGLRPQTLGIYDLPTHFRHAAPDAVTVAQHFKNHGYETQSLGKIFHVGHGNIDDQASWSIPSWKPKAPTYHLEASTSLPAKPRGNGPKGVATESADVSDAAYGEGQLAEELIVRLKAASSKPEKSFFIAGGFIRPHLPFVAPKRYWDLYNSAMLPMPKSNKPPVDAPKYAPQFGGELRAYSDMPNEGDIPPEQVRALIHGYYAATSYMDAQVGKVLDAMDSLKLWETTIVLLWGDHGWHLGDHGMWCKHTNYEQATRIPFLIAVPLGVSGTATKSLIETVDIYPTLCELAGLPIPTGLDGQSFSKVIKDPYAITREAITHVYPRNELLGRAIRNDRYRLVEWKKPGADPSTAEFELYDYDRDPEESKNVAKENPDIVEQLTAILYRQPEAKPQVKSASKQKERPQKAKKQPSKANG